MIDKIYIVWSIYAYLVCVIVLSIMLFGIMLYYFSKDRVDRIESPKFTMLDEDDVLDARGRAAIQSRKTLRRFQKGGTL